MTVSRYTFVLERLSSRLTLGGRECRGPWFLVVMTEQMLSWLQEKQQGCRREKEGTKRGESGMKGR